MVEANDRRVSEPEIVRIISDCINKLKELHEGYSKNKKLTPQELKSKLNEIRPKMELLTSKWVPDILYALLLSGGMGFNGLKHTLGMSSRVLSDKLQELVKNGLVKREEIGGSGTKRVKYKLTNIGKEVVFSLTPFLLGIYLANDKGCKN